MHSVLEGFAVGLQVCWTVSRDMFRTDARAPLQETAGDFWELLIAVLVHEVLCALAYGLSLLEQQAAAQAADRQSSGLSRASIASAIFVAATIPIGMLLGRALPDTTASHAALVARYVLEVGY